ncbi:alginate export family protein [Aquipseudomonas alcaligenes]|uniref:Alginate export family protein n=1 Tax=Aquipseudomonas alcaligenes TaxID=43263 RepID=A0AB73HTN7_AQUAC|nr:alginate export family protein [Pseudomonas alcaligenes]MDH0141094.1 alginate export family protein [Pseudomonas alcaligenes]
MCMKPTLLSLAIASATLAQGAFATEELSNLFTQGKPILDARYRFENVDQNNDLRDANAQTLRTRAGFQSGQWYGLSGLLEVDNVSRVGDDAYNSTRNGQKEYAVVADPDGTEVNQALLRYDHKLGSAVLGRQRINLDNQRFIGSVAWRQNEQTFDGALTQLKPIDGLTLSYAYLDQVNTMFGPDNGRYDNLTNPANIDGHSHLINAQYVFMPQLTATAYSYLLDLDNIAVAPTAAEGTLSSQTSGLRLNGVVAGVSYALEYAQQKDYGDNPLELDSEYYLAELGYTLKGVQLKAGYEVLGGDNGSGNRAFQTPLATKHAFQGWADQFLTTPADGIEDAYVGVTAPLLGGTLQAWYHDFSTEQGSDEYGNEIDLSYAHPIPGVKGLVGLLKYATYDSDDKARTVDTDKVWLQLQYTY